MKVELKTFPDWFAVQGMERGKKLPYSFVEQWLILHHCQNYHYFASCLVRVKKNKEELISYLHSILPEGIRIEESDIELETYYHGSEVYVEYMSDSLRQVLENLYTPKEEDEDTSSLPR